MGLFSVADEYCLAILPKTDSDIHYGVGIGRELFENKIIECSFAKLSCLIKVK